MSQQEQGQPCQSQQGQLSQQEQGPQGSPSQLLLERSQDGQRQVWWGHSCPKQHQQQLWQ